MNKMLVDLEIIAKSKANLPTVDIGNKIALMIFEADKYFVLGTTGSSI